MKKILSFSIVVVGVASSTNAFAAKDGLAQAIQKQKLDRRENAARVIQEAWKSSEAKKNSELKSALPFADSEVPNHNQPQLHHEEPQPLVEHIRAPQYVTVANDDWIDAPKSHRHWDDVDGEEPRVAVDSYARNTVAYVEALPYELERTLGNTQTCDDLSEIKGISHPEKISASDPRAVKEFKHLGEMVRFSTRDGAVLMLSGPLPARPNKEWKGGFIPHSRIDYQWDEIQEKCREVGGRPITLEEAKDLLQGLGKTATPGRTHIEGVGNFETFSYSGDFEYGFFPDRMNKYAHYGPQTDSLKNEIWTSTPSGDHSMYSGEPLGYYVLDLGMGDLKTRGPYHDYGLRCVKVLREAAPKSVVAGLIPAGKDTFSYVLERFENLDFKRLSKGEFRNEVKALGQEAFDRFRQEGYTNQGAMDRLVDVVETVEPRRYRLIESMLDGVGLDGFRWRH